MTDLEKKLSIEKFMYTDEKHPTWPGYECYRILGLNDEQKAHLLARDKQENYYAVTRDNQGFPYKLYIGKKDALEEVPLLGVNIERHYRCPSGTFSFAQGASNALPYGPKGSKRMHLIFYFEGESSYDEHEVDGAAALEDHNNPVHRQLLTYLTNLK